MLRKLVNVGLDCWDFILGKLENMGFRGWWFLFVIVTSIGMTLATISVAKMTEPFTAAFWGFALWVAGGAVTRFCRNEMIGLLAAAFLVGFPISFISGILMAMEVENPLIWIGSFGGAYLFWLWFIFSIPVIDEPTTDDSEGDDN